MNFLTTLFTVSDNRSGDIVRVCLFLLVVTLCGVTIWAAWKEQLPTLTGFLPSFAVAGATLIYGTSKGIAAKECAEPQPETQP